MSFMILFDFATQSITERKIPTAGRDWAASPAGVLTLFEESVTHGWRGHWRAQTKAVFSSEESLVGWYGGGTEGAQPCYPKPLTPTLIWGRDAGRDGGNQWYWGSEMNKSHSPQGIIFHPQKKRIMPFADHYSDPEWRYWNHNPIP